MLKKTTCILNLNYKNISPVESTSVLSDVSSNVTLMFHVDTESVSVLLLFTHIEDRQKKRLQRGNTQRLSCSLWSTMEMLLLGSSLPPSPLFSPLVIYWLILTKREGALTPVFYQTILKECSLIHLRFIWKKFLHLCYVGHSEDLILYSLAGTFCISCSIIAAVPQIKPMTVNKIKISEQSCFVTWQTPSCNISNSTPDGFLVWVFLFVIVEKSLNIKRIIIELEVPSQHPLEWARGWTFVNVSQRLNTNVNELYNIDNLILKTRSTRY